jgi:phenylalanyl-tRNA synthetase beta chain
MKISRDWVADYVDLTGLSDAEIAARLTEIGHAVEGLDSHGSDTVFEIEFTSNRVDAMSHLGVARELAAALGREMRTGTYEIAPAESSGVVRDIPISIEAPELCDRYTGLVVEGVTVRPSSARIRSRLEAVGLRPINNVVDVTNYIMLATGHPLHAFDLDRVEGPAIRVRGGRGGEKITTLDGVEREVDPSICIIGEDTRASAIGGIMGGGLSEISDQTRNILLECAHFTPAAIRRAARKLGMKTDASYRFERGVDPNDTVAVIEQAANLIVREAGGTRGHPVDVLARPAEPRTLVLRDGTLKDATAGIVGAGYALDLFTRLGFAPVREHDRTEVSVPTWRGDIEQEMDLVEEVVRFYGYENFPSVLPRLTTGDVRHDPMHLVEEQLRDFMRSCGLTEVVTYSFVSSRQNELISDEQPLAITNALSENIASMRLSIIPGLLDTVAHNRSYGNRDGALFEVGKIYHKERGELRERYRLAFVLFGGVQSHWGEPRRAYDFFDAKGIVEQMGARHHLEIRYEPAETRWLRSGASAVLRAGERQLGLIGVVRREIAEAFEIKGDVVAGEIDTEVLAASFHEWKMDSVSRFPGVPMVLGLMHQPSLPYEEIVAKVKELDVPFLREVGLRDRYFPPDAEEVKTLLGMWYQAADRSLTQDEVAEVHQRLSERVAAMLPVRVLGAEGEKN